MDASLPIVPTATLPMPSVRNGGEGATPFSQIPEVKSQGRVYRAASPSPLLEGTTSPRHARDCQAQAGTAVPGGADQGSPGPTVRQEERKGPPCEIGGRSRASFRVHTWPTAKRARSRSHPLSELAGEGREPGCGGERPKLSEVRSTVEALRGVGRGEPRSRRLKFRRTSAGHIGAVICAVANAQRHRSL
jgi:hypothetical protein